MMKSYLENKNRNRKNANIAAIILRLTSLLVIDNNSFLFTMTIRIVSIKMYPVVATNALSQADERILIPSLLTNLHLPYPCATQLLFIAS